MLDLSSLILQCAINVAPSTMMAIIKTESQGNPLALGINKGYRLQSRPKNPEQAAQWATYLEKNNYNFDVGLAQINIKNIHRYGYKASDALDPCTNLKMASDILAKNYHGALSSSSSSHEALQKAISAYNTGNYQSGFRNGYVQKVYANANSKPINTSGNIPTIIPINTTKKVIANKNTTLASNQRRSTMVYARQINSAANFY